MKRFNYIYCLLASASSLLFVGCTATAPVAILQEGRLVLAGSVPEATSADYGDIAYGFAPLTAVTHEPSQQTYIRFNRGERKIALVKGGHQIAVDEASNLSLLGSGSFAVQMIQVMPDGAPIWYAPDSYFIARGLAIPAENDGARFVRGALGNGAIYITPELAIHSAPYISDDIGGIWVSEGFLTELSKLVDVGTPVIIE